MQARQVVRFITVAGVMVLLSGLVAGPPVDAGRLPGRWKGGEVTVARP